MDDPWDVKSVRQPGYYSSCMKINGVPLLPPVLSKECRKEMQYYKLLAKEVEKRISSLQPYVDTDTESGEDKTDASELPESEHEYDVPKDELPADLTIAAIKDLDETLTSSPLHTELYNLSSKSKAEPSETPPQLLVDFSLSFNESNRKIKDEKAKTPPMDVPERDYNCTKKVELVTDVETNKHKKKDKILDEVVNYSITVSGSILSDPFPDSFSHDGPASLSSKSFTGSLNNILMESERESHNLPKLVRQRSYTLLKPSPQLLAHLEVQSLNTGVEMRCISMSESLSNLSTPNKKRRSWDLETAKVKWSNMAQELKQKNLTKPIYKKPMQHIKRAGSPQRARSVYAERGRQSSLPTKASPKTEPVQKARKQSPVRSIPSNRTIVKEPIIVKGKGVVSPTNTNPKKDSPNSTSPKIPAEAAKQINHKKGPLSPKSTTPKPQLISESDDPATKVRELYEKIQKQQLIQMASLVEKQKREQLLLQQVFEEQNNLLFKQLKTICPKSPIEAKEAWGDKNHEASRGPVSLSQLINHKSPDPSITDSPISTLTDSNKYINQCDSVLKKSRDISSSLKRKSQNGTKIQSPRTQPEGSRTRTSSPNRRNTPISRRLNYDSASDRECDPMLTDRTNDTMADLNVTFPSDTEEVRPYSHNGIPAKEMSILSSSTPTRTPCSTDSAIKCMEQTIHNSINSSRRATLVTCQPSPKQRDAATKIVAYAKGYLVRRLLRTARVQSTVQTIRDALLCALQLHQERGAIRGADVDLHRRLIQQITAACYSLHDTFIASSPAQRCAAIASDRARLATLAAKTHRLSDIMSQSHTGAFPTRPKRFAAPSASLMTQSNYETYSSEKSGRARYMPPPRRRPWH